ncbi:unnamed protein product [Rotaria socialis]|uniref:UBC core domain-containing protein n=2 Tax=Rotaria socialis TaxID=392032 RepID=A0A818CDK8_9BILA|nr:unnamed protein product [Rotaria socialis]CAF4625664.1 unnamed protein product [Rotaria socialis]
MAKGYYHVLDLETRVMKHIPVHHSDTTIGQFMEEVANRFKIRENFELYHKNELLRSTAIIKALEVDTLSDPITIDRCTSTLYSFAQHADTSTVQSNRKGDSAFLPPIITPRISDIVTPTSPVSDVSSYKMPSKYTKLDKINQQPPSSSYTVPSSINRSESNKFIVTQEMQRNVQNSFEQNTISEIDGILDSDDIQAEVHESYSESDFESDDDNNHEKLEESSKFFQKSRRLSKSEPMLFQANENNGENYRNDFEEDSPQFCYVPESSKSEFPVPKITDSGLSYCEKINSTASMEYSRLLIVRIRSLCKIYCLNIAHNSTIKNLVNVIWDEIPFEEERYTMDSHVLLLFNHRLHIFIESNPSELVKDFLQLSPDDSVTDFYAYGLPIEHRDFMYNFDTGHNSLFKVSDSWDPVYFTDYKQLERSQSTLLSSLYALALYFRCNNRESAGYRRAMEAQFFLQLRKYLYPPAVLAFKHTIEGSMFWFEKTLLMDALIQLLIRLCPKIVCEIPIDSTEYFDFIPLLFCWLLEKCDPNEVEEDFFAVVKLTDIRRDEHFYFQDPVTTSDINCQKLILEEFSETQSHDKLTRHVDLRSFNRYLASPANHSPNLVFTHKEYEIYHPSTDISSEFKELPCWTENEIYRYNKIMSRKYPSLTIITRGALTARISNQLVLLNKERTVSLLFSRQNKTTENKGRQHNINHFFQIFDPLDASNESSLVTVESFLDEQQNWPDPRLPIYFSNNVITQPNNVPFFETNTIKPAEQVTVVLLDLSRSMFDHNVGDDDRTGKCTHINMCKMMLGTLSDNMLPKDEVHAFGLIEFGERVKVTCPITRDRNKFEKALQSHMLLGEWTHMYDAVNEAVRKINVYINSPLRAGKNCRKLIICLSDGVNNAGPTTIESLYKQIEEHNIVIDFVSFLRDDQLNDEKKNNSIRNFRQLCIKSGGYVYSKLHYRSKIEVAGMFEQEAAVWLSKRARESRGVVEKPERHVNPIFQRLAVRQVSNNTNTQNSSRLVRVFKELTVTQSHSSNEFFVFSILDNISFWKVILKGPQQTPYENKYWMIYVSFDSGYPSYPPNVRFMTPIYHVNISGDGKICHQIFNESWAEPTKMTTVFNSIIDLLKKPNFSEAVSIEKAHLYRDDPNEYEEQAKGHAIRFAKSDIESLKSEYQINDDEELIEEVHQQS